MGERIDRMKVRAKTYIQSDQVNAVKKHFNDHKVFYAIVGTSAITWFVSKNTQQASIKDPTINVLNKPISILSRGQKTITKIVQVVERDGRGHPGYPIYVPEWDEIIPNQLKLAERLGVDKALVSQAVRGLIPDIKGVHPQRIPA